MQFHIFNTKTLLRMSPGSSGDTWTSEHLLFNFIECEFILNYIIMMISIGPLVVNGLNYD